MAPPVDSDRGPERRSTLDTGLKALLVLAWPVMLSRAAQAVIGLCDALMIAPLGEDALAATTSGAMNILSVLILPMGVAFIIQSFAAQFHGKGDTDGARRYGWYGVILAGLAGVLGFLAIPLVDPTLGLMAYSVEVQALMGDYIELRLLAVGGVIGYEAIGAWYGGLGNTRAQMVGSLVMMGLNIGLNYVFIGGHLGAPAMGVQGAALASVIATWTGGALLLGWFVAGRGIPRGNEQGEEQGGEVEGVAPSAGGRLQLGEFGRMLRFGLPNGVNYFLEFAAFMLFIDFIVADVDTVTVAALMVVVQVNSVSFMPAFGLASSGAILSGQAIGAGLRDAVPGIVRRTMATAAVWQVSVGLLYLAAPQTIMKAFAPPDAADSEIVAMGATLLALSAAWQLFDAIGMSLAETLRAAGDTAWTMWARLIVAWLVFLPCGYVGVVSFGGGGVAAILSIVGYIALLALLLGWRFRSGAWRAISLTEEG